MTVLKDLLSSKKFVAMLVAIAVFVAGRFGLDVDPATLDHVFAAILVYVGAQGIADNGKSAALIADARAATFGASLPAGLLATGAAQDSTKAGAA